MFASDVIFEAPLVVPVPTAATHAVLDEDDQEHPLLVVTVTLVEPPDELKLIEVGDTE